jgi:hypothetical protein
MIIEDNTTSLTCDWQQAMAFMFTFFISKYINIYQEVLYEVKITEIFLMQSHLPSKMKDKKA